MSWLYGNQSKYDKNGDGFLNGTEWTEWYYGTYGHDIEMAERRRISEQLGAWEQIANKLFAELLAGYDGYIAGAKEYLTPWDNDARTLAERVFISWMVRGLVLGNSYNTKWVTTGGGQVAANRAWTPYKSIVAAFLKERPICTVKDIEKAIMTKQIPYEAESNMTDDGYGLFWQRIIPSLSEYREDCLGSFYAERTPEYPEYEAINKIVRGLFRCIGIFSGKSEVEADEPGQNYLEIFISHWLCNKGRRGKLYTNDEIYDKVIELRESLGEKSEESYSGIDSMSVDELKKLREELEAYYDDALDLVPDDDDSRADEYNSACDELVFLLDAIESRLADLEEQKNETKPAAEIEQKPLIAKIAVTITTDDDEIFQMRYAQVYIDKIGRSFSYIADDTIAVGDMVAVPFGKFNTEMQGEVKSIDLYLSNNTPYPASKTKTILRRLLSADSEDERLQNKEI